MVPVRGFSRASRYIFLSALISFIFINAAEAAPVIAAESPVSVPPSEEVRFRIYWNGIRLGKLWLYWKEDGERYEAKVSIQTSGVARVFSKQNRRAEVTGRMRRVQGMEYYVPEAYRYTSKSKNKTREVTISYDTEGNVASFSVTPPDDPKRRPKVKKSSRNAAYDPMSALRAVFHYAYNLSQGGVDARSSLTVFDGRRLTRIVALTAGGKKNCGEGCVAAQGYRELLEGYTEEEQQEFEAEKEPPVTLEFVPTISRFPQKITAQTPLGPVSAKRY